MQARVTRFSIELALVLCLSGLVSAQVPEIIGKVTDQTGAPIPKARVLLVELATLETQHLMTNADGSFSFTGLKYPEYEVLVASPGFVTHAERVETQPRGDVVVVGENTPARHELRITLKVGHT